MVLPLEYYANLGIAALLIFSVGCLFAGIAVLWNGIVNNKYSGLRDRINATSRDMMKYLESSDVVSIEQVQSMLTSIKEGGRPDIALMAVNRSKAKEQEEKKVYLGDRQGLDRDNLKDTVTLYQMEAHNLGDHKEPFISH